MTASSIAVCAAVLLGLAAAQVPFIGKCPSIKYQDDFDATKYFVGDWYEQSRFFAIFEIGQKCVQANYQILSDGFVQVNNSGFAVSKGIRVNQLGKAYCDKDQPAACFVKFFDNQPWASYNVLATDYDTFSVVYSCSSLFGSLSTEFGWILTRQANVDEALMERARAVLTSNGIDATQLQTVAQDCY